MGNLTKEQKQYLLTLFSDFSDQIIRSAPRKDRERFIDHLDILRQIWYNEVHSNSNIEQLVSAKRVIVVDVLNMIGVDRLDGIRDLTLDATPPPGLRAAYSAYLNGPMNVTEYRIHASCQSQLEYMTVMSHMFNLYGKDDVLYIFVYRTKDADDCFEEPGFNPIDTLFDSTRYWSYVVPGGKGDELDDLMVIFLTHMFSAIDSSPLNKVSMLSTDNYRWAMDKELIDIVKGKRALWEYYLLQNGKVSETAVKFNTSSLQGVSAGLD